jgi:hypothetical protein
MKKRISIIGIVGMSVLALTACSEQKINYNSKKYTLSQASEKIENELERQNKGKDIDVSVTFDTDDHKKKKKRKH